ncbi:MAG: tetratricopeptide repeat protein [bacterium]|nr:tetratricopeptide repeat protein [bacterium]
MRKFLFFSLCATVLFGLTACTEGAEAGNKVDVGQILAAADTALADGRYDEAELDYRLVLSLGAVEEHLTRARTGLNSAVAERCYREAYRDFEDEQSLSMLMGPQQGMSQEQMSRAQLGLDIISSPLTSAGLAALNDGLAADPLHPGLNYLLGLTYARHGVMDKAEAQFTYCDKIAPDNWAGPRGLAQIYSQTGRMTEAMAEAEIALTRAATPADQMAAYEMLVQFSFNPANPEAYKTYLKEAKEKFPEYGDPLALEAMLVLLAGGATPDLTAGVPLAEEALAKPFLSESNRLTLVQNMAVLYAQLGRFDDALSLIEEHVRNGGRLSMALLQVISQVAIIQMSQ